MRKFLLILVQLLVIITLSAQTYMYTSANLNLRSGPSVSYGILATIPSGTRILMVEVCDCDWIRIHYNGKIGYVSSRYLTDQKVVNNSNKNSVRSTGNTNSKTRYYTNSSGQRVQSPTRYNSAPSGATALCRDGTYSFSKNRRGTCSGHGGGARWLK